MTDLEPSAFLCREDEMRVHRGPFGDEFVTLFIAAAADRVGQYRIRAVFADREGFVTDECIVFHNRRGPMHLTIRRFGKPDFVFTAPVHQAPRLKAFAKL